MKMSLERKMYAEIQKKLFSIIPEKWESIYLYASVIDLPNKRVTGEMYFYYFPKGIIKRKPINCYEIPEIFNIDEIEYGNIIASLYNLIKNLRTIYYKNHQKLWSNLTISIENSRFNVEYDYQKIENSERNSYERHVVWRYLYLKTDERIFSRKEKKIINDYLEKNGKKPKVKKDRYSENIYDIQVKNIVDYEKTLSVEEALAQSDDETEKKKHSFLKRKVTETDDEEENFNNQILNWKK